MTHHREKLTEEFARTVTVPGKYRDAHGLMLRVMPSGSKQWVQRIAVHGRRRELGLGGYPLVSLAEARKAAFNNRRIARGGGDPFAANRSGIPTFQEAADKVIEIRRPSWSSAKHAAEWEATLHRYVFPQIGGKRVDQIGTSDVAAVLMPIWHEKNQTARRVRQRIGTVMKWSVGRGHRQDNPAGEAMDSVLPRHDGTPRRRPALPYAEVADAIQSVRCSAAARPIKLAFEFLVLTARNSGEVRPARWDEFNFEGAEWSIPDMRLAANQNWRVPLSTRAMEVLREARENSDTSGLVFPSPTGRPLADSRLSELCRELNIQAVPNGFRSSFRAWAMEQANVPYTVVEVALARTSKSEARAGDMHSDLFHRWRELMNDWADYLVSA